MRLFDKLKATNPDSAIDEVFCDIIDRSMKQMYIHHAKTRGASAEWLAKLEPLDSDAVVMAVEVCYGTPPLWEKSTP